MIKEDSKNDAVRTMANGHDVNVFLLEMICNKEKPGMIK
jgi:hypothetical protein